MQKNRLRNYVRSLIFNDNAFYVIESFVTQGINMSENHIHLIISRKVANGVQNNTSTLRPKISLL